MNALQQDTTLQCGKYRIKSTLGQGSFGITYLASMQVIGDGCDMEIDVALKEFFMQECNTRNPQNTSVTGSQSELFKKYRDKFMTEAKNLEKMSKYGDIVKIYDVFEENDTAYFSMEYVEGLNLDDYIKRRGRLPESEAIECIKSIATALKHLHDNKMLHLDLKPKNIMRRNDGKLYLIDFGLSKQFDDSGEPESSTSIGLGTPGYAPIEQANFKGVFAPTLDIYALGATFYKMLTGVTAPESSDIVDTGFTPLKTKLLDVGASTPTRDVIEKAMRVKKTERFQTIDEFLTAFDNKNSDGNTIIAKTNNNSKNTPKEIILTVFQVLVMLPFFFWVGCGIEEDILNPMVRGPILEHHYVGYIDLFCGLISILLMVAKNSKAQIGFALLTMFVGLYMYENVPYYSNGETLKSGEYVWLVTFSGICFFIYGLLGFIKNKKNSN